MADFTGKYPFMTSYLKSEESKLVTPAHVDRLLRAPSVPEAVAALRDTDIGSYLDSVLITNFAEADRALWFYLEDCLKRIARFNETPRAMQKLIDTYMEKYDVLNMKAAIEGVASGKKPSLIPLGTMYRYGWLADLAGVQDLETIKGVLIRCNFKNYAAIVDTYPVEGDTRQRLEMETALDREYYADLLKAARRVSDRSDLIKAIGTIMDMRNLKMILRGAARNSANEAIAYSIGGGYLISAKDVTDLALTKLEDMPAKVPYAYQKLVQEVVTSYGKTHNITAVGDIVDRYEFTVLREMLSPKIMSPVMIVWYLILKETEVRNLRIVLRALFDNIPLEEIKDYLVMTV